MSQTTRVWQRMLSGRRLDLADPSPLDIEIEDIAHGLARVARWNGQTKGEHIFSVAQHCLLVEHVICQMNTAVSPEIQLMALLHDASEYVVGDLISPFKALIGERYKEVEERLIRAIHMRFGLPANVSDKIKHQIKEADKQAAFLEATHLAGFSKAEARSFFGSLDDRLSEWDNYLVPKNAQNAQVSYLKRFRAISEKV